jgi:hypothetical protein
VTFPNHSEGLFRNAIIEAKSGEKLAARRYIERGEAAGGEHELAAEAWFQLARILDDAQEKRQAIESALAHNMNHALARRELAILDGKLKREDVIDANRLAPIADGSTPADAQRFTCPKCGGRMSFSPDGQTLVCEYCEAQDGSARGGRADEEDFVIAMATERGHRKPVLKQVFHCRGCGAEFLLPPGVISATCAWCNSPHVVSLENQRELIEPDGIIPHGFNRQQAAQLLVEWVQGHRIQPEGKVEAPRGLYLPVWTFDIGGQIDYSGTVSEEQNEFPGRGQRVVRLVRDSYPIYMDDLPIPAGGRLARPFGELLPTYDLTRTLPYDPRMLADWPAEVNDVTMSDASLKARQRAFAYWKQILPGRIGAIDGLKMSSANMAIDSFKLILLPAWTTVYPAEGSDHLVLINGQNGRVQGEIAGQEKTGLAGWLEDIFKD